MIPVISLDVSCRSHNYLEPIPIQIMPTITCDWTILVIMDVSIFCFIFCQAANKFHWMYSYEYSLISSTLPLDDLINLLPRGSINLQHSFRGDIVNHFRQRESFVFVISNTLPLDDLINHLPTRTLSLQHYFLGDIVNHFCQREMLCLHNLQHSASLWSY